MNKPVIGIVGAGKLGLTLAKLALDSGYMVNIAGSGQPEKIELAISVLAPGAVAMTVAEVSEKSNIVILALPLSKYRTLSPMLLNGKIVIDAMNYWWEVDGSTNTFYDEQTTSSENVQKYFSKSVVIKAFNHMGYHDLAAMPHQKRVIAYAGDDQAALEQVAELITDFGFVPYLLGSLHETTALQPGGVLFGVNQDLTGVKKLLKQ